MKLAAPFQPSSFIEHDPAMYNTIKGLQEWEGAGGAMLGVWPDRLGRQRHCA
jgi:hypothetical protein